ncbi:MAG: DNA replication/repair protein RecF [Tissierellales bacterium]|nr:DNA replication/repair protein RecF [Tissierellales bacterium]MBN2827200.1 DNA replication/repair protein RecF [Tissierellales bacterium]
MYVKKINLNHYRNFENIQVELNQKLNIFIGNNAQGKTNLLESIFVSAVGKSFRFSKDDNLINWKSDTARIKIYYQRKDDQKEIDINFVKCNKKNIKVNGLSLEKNSELVGITNVVVFSPDSINIIKGTPSEKRRYLNVELSQLKPNYKYLLTKYNKILMQRNNLLKKIIEKREDKKVLPVWNEHLINYGTEIIGYRLDYLKKIMFFSEKIHDRISGGTEKLDLIYRSNLGKINDLEKKEIKNIFRDKLISNFERELIRKSTLFGPHLDDIEILINHMDSKYYSSQGQKRTAALSIVLSEVNIVHEEKDEYPILLLDDVLSELDNNRKKYLINFIEKIQTIITSTDDTDLIDLLKDKEKKIFYIKNGKIEGILE